MSRVICRVYAIFDGIGTFQIGGSGPPRQGRRGKPLPLTGIRVDMLMVGLRCLSRYWLFCGCAAEAALPWRSSRPGVAPVHLPSANVISPLTRIHW